jgi:hypothetical protein
MPIRRISIRAIVLVCVILFVVARVGVMRYLKDVSRPLGQGQRIESSAAVVSQPAWLEFLNRDFNIVTDVRALPGSVLQKYIEPSGSRLLMVNPGQEFEATDIIRVASLPRERLIFAGVAGDKCFVHYETGGKPHVYVVEFFGATSSRESVEPQWIGYCNAPAASIQDLRSQVIHGGCSQPPISR